MTMFNDISSSEKVKNYAKSVPRGPCSFLGPREEEKWYGTHTNKPEGQWNSTADVMVENFSESGHPIFRGINALNRGVLKRKGGRCTIHFTGESPNAELLFRTIHSANQLSIFGAVASWCENLAQLIPGQTYVFTEKYVAKANDQSSQKLEPQEVDSLVQTPRRNDDAAGNRLRVYLQRFEEWATEVQLTKACESAGFMRRVSIGMHYKTTHDVNDCFEGKTGACREYGASWRCRFRNHCVDRWTHRKLVQFFNWKLHVVLTSMESTYRSPSTSGDRSKSWVVKTRGSNRDVDELHYNDPDRSPERHELANHVSTEDTRASLPKTQSNLMGDHSEAFPIDEREWNDMSAYGEFKGTTLESQSRNETWSWCAILTSKIEKLMVQFIWNRWVQSCDTRFQEQGEYTFLILNGLIKIWKASNQTRFQYCKNSNVLLYSRDSTAHWRWNDCAWAGSCRYSTRKEFLYHRGSFNVESILQAGLIAGEVEKTGDSFLHTIRP